MKANSFTKLFEKAKERETYLTASIILEFTEGLYELMQVNNLSRKELAKRLGTSPAYITKILRGDINFTVDSMVRLAKAAGGIIQIHVGQEEVRWFEIAQGEKEELPERSEYTRKEPQVKKSKRPGATLPRKN